MSEHRLSFLLQWQLNMKKENKKVADKMKEVIDWYHKNVTDMLGKYVHMHMRTGQ